MINYQESGIKSIIAPPSKAEMQSRVDRVRKKMEEHELEYYVCFCPDNIYYLSNFANFVHERPFIMVIPVSGKIKFLVPKLEIPHVITRSVGDIEMVEYFEFPAPEGIEWKDRFQAIFEVDGVVGVESSCPLFIYESISGTKKQHDIIDEIRMIKSSYEIGRIKYASEIVTGAMKKLLKMAKPGLSMLKVNSSLNKDMMLKLLLDIPDINFLATRLSIAVQPPSISHDPHNFTNVMEMNMEEGGPHVAIINCVVNGYSTEIERTFFLGGVPEIARKPYEVMMKARNKALELCVPGENMADVDRQVNNVFKEAGYEDNLLHRTGHSIGVTGHEGPFLADGYDRIIEPGMFFTVEPGLYIPGIGGFRHSDTILTTDTDNISLTPFAENLEDLTIEFSKFSMSQILIKNQTSLMKIYAKARGIELFEK